MTTTVGLNLLWLVPGAVGGSEQSTLATLRALRDLAPADLDLRLYVLEPFLRAHPDVASAFSTEVLHQSGRSRPARIAAEVSWLAGRTRGLELVHHAGGTAPLLGRSPFVLTVHDLQPLEGRDTHGRAKRSYLARAIPRSVRCARAVAVPSEFVRASVVARLGADPARVVAIPHGVQWPPPELTPAEEVRARYRLEGPLVLYPAITYPHKNHATLVEAFSLLRAEHPDAVLVLTGGVGACEAQLAAEIDRLGLRRCIRRLGRIPDADVAGLLSTAAVVAVPSRYEGFGLPAAEAMVAGVALVAADAAALPEVVGDAGVLVDPDDPGAWAEAISALLSDPAKQARLVARGHDRVARYTWQANAGAFADLYRSALGAS